MNSTDSTRDARSLDPRISKIQRLVGEWFQEHQRPLPWRDPQTSAWAVLLSEVMSQQTPVSRVEPIWRRWLDLWPTPADLAAAPTADVLREWASLGYPRRALRLADCARSIVEDHDGQVPRTYQELLALPGIGDYTAAAVVAFAYGERSTVVDTNVRRVLARAIDGDALAHPTYSAAERAFARKITPDDSGDAALWAAASMELGAVICTARVALCEQCPIRALCAWRAAGYPEDEHAHKRTTQKFTGTDRQVRGKVMKLLREAHGPVLGAQVDLVWPDAAQLERCVGSLIEDGLIEQDGEAYSLPAS
ncbi:A/G-specific adenine glycosylase [Timonella senegalensis]|uniref:A/G-specific adenine glycosylase n=1 Tax=Timonella senegalensis TaxID=1465825 RepID=UPI0028AE72F5|nr:A/G-specific adenine glycosylase [Timonella senegalensis]